MKTCREVEGGGGACCLEQTDGANEKAVSGNVFKDAGAGALRSRDEGAGT
ncbi:MAG: hypothetical protein ACJ74T_03560 [Pyrinomonadaceae bacterium]